jgi:sortase A
MKNLKKKLPNILLTLIFIIGAGIFAYPTISNQWNKYHQSAAIASYEQQVESTSEEDFTQAWNDAEAYNASITENTFSSDAFADEEKNLRETPYWNVLNLSDTGIMGYISIPEINQKLPIYHGTSDSVLQIGAGHLSGTKLPIGGSGNHSVIAAHRGLPSAKLFSDLDKLQIGDKFYIHILNETLAYEVDQILPMVDKDDTEALSSALQNVEGEDYVTLFTCTPYGINSHRLLVRGTRVEYHGEDEAKVSDETMLESIQEYYMLYALLVIAVILLIFAIVKVKKWKKRKAKEAKNEKIQ